MTELLFNDANIEEAHKYIKTKRVFNHYEKYFCCKMDEKCFQTLPCNPLKNLIFKFKSVQFFEHEQLLKSIKNTNTFIPLSLSTNI